MMTDPIDAALAYALWDAECSTRLSEQAPDVNEYQMGLAARVRYGLRMYGYEVVKADLLARALKESADG